MVLSAVSPSRLSHVGTDPVEARARYDVEAPWYDWWTAPFQRYRDLAVERLDLHEGDVVLDIGCGTGLAFEALERRIGPAGRIIGLDVSDGMLDEAFARADRHGWTNVELIEAAAEEAVFPVLGDAALFCATHDVLRSPVALEHVIAALRPGASVAAAGGKWAPPWAGALNWMALWEHTPFVTTFEGFGRPWDHLAALLADVEVEELFLGAGYVLKGTTPGPADNSSTGTT